MDRPNAELHEQNHTYFLLIPRTDEGTAPSNQQLPQATVYPDVSPSDMLSDTYHSRQRKH